MKSLLKILLVLPGVLVSSCFDEKDITPVQADTFIKYYNNYPVFSAADVKETTQGYALLGTVENSSGATQVCLLRTDKYGNLLDSARYYGRLINSRAYCLQVLDDGGYGILGSSVNPATNKRQVYFVRTDATGDPVWERYISHTGNVEAKHFEVNASGQYIMTGYCNRNNVDLTLQIWIGALDNTGAQPWVPKISSFSNDAEGRHLQILNDNSIVITGVSRNDASDPENNTHAYILMTNSTGGPLDIYYLPATSDEEGNAIRVIDSQNFLVTGTVESGSSGTNIMLEKVSRVNFAFDTEWEKEYGGGGNDIGQCLLTQGGSIYLLNTATTFGTNTAISLIITDSEGNSPKYFNFGLGSQLTASSFEQTSDNGFIISGTNKHYENSISATLIKTLANGAL